MRESTSFIKPAGADEIASAIEQAGKASDCAWLVSGAEGDGKTTLLHWLIDDSHRRNPGLRVACFTASPRHEPMVGAHEGDRMHPAARARAWDRHPMRPRPGDDAYSAVLLLLHHLGHSAPSMETSEESPLTMEPATLLKKAWNASFRAALAGLTPAPISAIMAAGEELLGRGGGGPNRMLDLESVADLRPRLKAGMLEALGATPSLLVVDDIQYLDPGSIEVLGWLLQNMHGLPVCILLAGNESEMIEFAQSELMHPAQGVVAHAVASGGLRRLTLPPWSAEQVREYAATSYPGLRSTDDLVAFLMRRAEGQPLFTVEILKLLEATGHLSPGPEGMFAVVGDLARIPVPDRVEEVIGQQLQRIDTEVQGILESASVEGVRFHSGILHSLVQPVLRHRLAEHLDAAESYYRIVSSLIADPRNTLGPLYQFSHALVHDVVYAQIPPAVQARLHRLVADELIRATAGSPEAMASEIVQHCLKCADYARVAEYSAYFAEQALRSYDWAAALRGAEQGLFGLEHAGEGPSSLPLRLRLGRAQGVALYRLQRWEEAGAVLARTADEAELMGSPEIATETLCLLSLLQRVHRDTEAAEFSARRALTMAKAADKPWLRLSACVALHRLLGSRPPALRDPVYRDEIRPEFEAVYEEARRHLDPRLEAHALRWLARTARMLKETDSARSLLQSAFEKAQALKDYRLLVELTYLKVDLLLSAGERARSHAAYHQGVTAARDTGDPMVIADLLTNYAGRLLEDGLFDRARACNDEAAQLAGKYGLAEQTCMCCALEGRLAEMQGRTADAEVAHRQHLDVARRIGNLGGLTAATLGLAACRLEQGQPVEAMEILDNLALTENEGHHYRDSVFLRARILASLGRAEDAGAVLAGIADTILNAPDRFYHGMLRLAQAEVARAQGVEDSARARAGEARAVFEELEARWPSAHTRRRIAQAAALTQPRESQGGSTP